jgi:hypothetical protein
MDGAIHSAAVSLRAYMPMPRFMKGSDMAQECLHFVVVLFQMEVNISILMPNFALC